MSLVFHSSDVRIGCHVKKYPKLYDTVKAYCYSPLRSYQIYLSSGRGYAPPKLDIDDLMKARELLSLSNQYVVVHGCLLYNLCGATKYKNDPDFHKKLYNTAKGLTAELDIGVGLGVGVIVHIGSCIDRIQGIKRIGKTITDVLTRDTDYAREISKALGMNLNEFKKRRRIILENAAGEGSKIGSTLQDLKDIYSSISPEHQKQVTVCIDTAHIFGAGQYDFGLMEDTDRFYRDFPTEITLEVFHLNDSRVKYNEKKDRHEYLGEGHQFGSAERMEGLKYFLGKCGVPVICETPDKKQNGEIGGGGMEDIQLLSILLNMNTVISF
jgi:endonuclease IV